MLSKDMEFESDRLKFRGIKKEDAPLIVKWRSNPEIYKNLFRGAPLTIEEHLEWFKHYMRDNSRFDFMIISPDGSEVGTVSLTDIDNHCCDVSYIMGESSAKGKGYSKEAVERITDLAFDSGITKVSAKILPHNVASMHVAEGAGYTEEERFFCKKKSCFNCKSYNHSSPNDFIDSETNIVICTTKSWNIELAERLVARIVKQGGKAEVWGEDTVLTKEALDIISPRYVFFPHWSQIIPNDVFTNYECIVFHMTDLPYGRGGSPLQNLIVSGVDKTMISAIRVVAALDAGPIYMKLPLRLEGSAEEIYKRAAQIIFHDMIPEIIRLQPEPVPQVGEVVKFARRRPEQSELVAGMTEREVYDTIRMLDAEGYPKAFLQLGELTMEFSKAEYEQDALCAKVHIMEASYER